VTPARPEPVFAPRLSFPDPIGRTEDVSEALKRLAAQLCGRLSEQAYGLCAVRLSIFRADKKQMHIDIGLARPSRDAGQILRQAALKLDTIDAGCGIDMMRLSALKAEPFTAEQQRFAEADTQNRMDELTARLGNRLGFDRVLRWRGLQSHQPRRAFNRIEAVACTNPSAWSVNLSRPLMLCDAEPVAVLTPGRPPKSFSWRRQTYTSARVHGPERIGPEWWVFEGSEPLRDYWQVESAEGPRLWLSSKPGEQPTAWQVMGVFP